MPCKDHTSKHRSYAGALQSTSSRLWPQLQHAAPALPSNPVAAHTLAQHKLVGLDLHSIQI